MIFVAIYMFRDSPKNSSAYPQSCPTYVQSLTIVTFILEEEIAFEIFPKKKFFNFFRHIRDPGRPNKNFWIPLVMPNICSGFQTCSFLLC
jgi:hypothetical protein